MASKRRIFSILTGTVLAVGATIAVVMTRTDGGFRWFLDRTYRREFPDVPIIQADELAVLLRSGAHPALLDTRPVEEYRVSRIAGARRIDPGTFRDADVAGLDRARPVIVYCSVGYRSARVAQRLRSLGFRDVRNLYGGIFWWYNQGREVVNDSGPVEAIHPFDFLWGQFITRGGKRYEP